MTTQFFWRSMVTGVLARAALIKSIYYRSVYLTEKSRTKLSNSDIMNHISTDVGQTILNWSRSNHLFTIQVSRIDSCAQWFVSLHIHFTSPVHLLIFCY